ncbi:30S ribosomal protein S8 [Candidatus Tremblaya princeps]|uniref:Small ribosomal subunit protein uS8 n=1 Tax=Tremblaya princeps TaxID=189385 RepID=A0A143WPA6_TREPR|nr:30S ribosomal protein S8 [Candidatus Tremblaya princeps]
MGTVRLSDTLAHIRNCMAVHRRVARLRITSANVSLARTLNRAGFAPGFCIAHDLAAGGRQSRWLRLELRRAHASPAMLSLVPASRPGLRVHANAASLRPSVYCNGMAIISTTKGMMTGRLARRLGIGGEVVCHVL